MLEYLKYKDALYPFYPMVELIALREQQLVTTSRESFFRDVIDNSNSREDSVEVTEIFLVQPPTVQLELLQDGFVYSLLYDTTLVTEGSLEVALHVIATKWRHLDHETLMEHISDTDPPWREAYFERKTDEYLRKRARKNRNHMLLEWRSYMRLQRELKRPPRHSQPSRLVFGKRVVGRADAIDAYTAVRSNK